jgi:redox-sensitive bicupin YhaK (pirin superfamily)
MPQASPRMLGLQLWINLPRQDKWAPPQYRDLTAALIPRVTEAGGSVGVIAGHYGPTRGATQGDYVFMAISRYTDIYSVSGRSMPTATGTDNPKPREERDGS